MNRAPLAKPPPPSKTPSSQYGCLSLLLAFLTLVGIFSLLVFLTTGFFAPVALIALVIFGIVAFHYCVWGWWLGRIIREEEKESRV